MDEVSGESGSRTRSQRAGHPDHALTPAAIRHLKPGKHCDGNGLYLQVDESGAKRWIVRTTIHGKRCEIGVGGLKRTSLAKARERAIEICDAARNGGDPLAAKRDARRRAERESRIPVFESAARTVYAEHSKTFRNAKHAAQWITSLEKYVFPHIGTKRVDAIDSADVLKVLSPVWLEKPETADRVKQRMRTVFAWCIASGHRTAGNPIEGITKVLPKHNEPDKHHAALPYGDVLAFIQALHSDDAVSGRLAFEFLILTASRTNEVIKARWREFDIERAIWTRPGEHMKAKKEHKVPLAPRCLEILAQAQKISDGSDYVFPGARAGRGLSNMAFHAVLRRMGKTGFTPHGFRSSFRDWAEEKTKHKKHTIDTALAHVVRDKVEAAYLRTQALEDRRELMNQWARFCSAEPSAKVVKMAVGKRR